MTFTKEQLKLMVETLNVAIEINHAEYLKCTMGSDSAVYRSQKCLDLCEFRDKLQTELDA